MLNNKSSYNKSIYLVNIFYFLLLCVRIMLYLHFYMCNVCIDIEILGRKSPYVFYNYVCSLTTFYRYMCGSYIFYNYDINRY